MVVLKPVTHLNPALFSCGNTVTRDMASQQCLHPLPTLQGLHLLWTRYPWSPVCFCKQPELCWTPGL